MRLLDRAQRSPLPRLPARDQRYYFAIEQFYMTFPSITRHIDAEGATRIITLITRAIAVASNVIHDRLGKLLKPYASGPNVAGCIRLALGAWARCQATSAPASQPPSSGRGDDLHAEYYDQLGRMAPKGKEGPLHGLAFVPSAVGAWIGGQVSARSSDGICPSTARRNPFMIWSIYA